MTTRINHVKGLVTVGERSETTFGRIQEGSGALVLTPEPAPASASR